MPYLESDTPSLLEKKIYRYMYLYWPYILPPSITFTLVFLSFMEQEKVVLSERVKRELHPITFEVLYKVTASTVEQ